MHQRLRWLTLIGAALLLLGVLVFCHGQWRGAAYIDGVNRLLDQMGDQFPEGESAENIARRMAVLDSFFFESWVGYEILAPFGAGLLAGSLVLLAAARRCRFGMRTLLIATVYCAVLIGVPFGALQPQLHRPALSLSSGGSFWNSGIRYEQHSARPGGGPGWSFPLVSGKSLVVALVGLAIVPAIILCPLPKRRQQSIATDTTALQARSNTERAQQTAKGSE
jgi:hypothetical protein